LEQIRYGVSPRVWDVFRYRTEACLKRVASLMDSCVQKATGINERFKNQKFQNISSCENACSQIDTGFPEMYQLKSINWPAVRCWAFRYNRVLSYRPSVLRVMVAIPTCNLLEWGVMFVMGELLTRFALPNHQVGHFSTCRLQDF